MEKPPSKQPVKNYIFGIDKDNFYDYARASFKELCNKKDFKYYSNLIKRYKLTNFISKNLCNVLDGLTIYGAIKNNNADIIYFWFSLTEVVRFAFHMSYRDDKNSIRETLKSLHSNLKPQTLDEITEEFNEEDYDADHDPSDWWKKNINDR